MCINSSHTQSTIPNSNSRRSRDFSEMAFHHMKFTLRNQRGIDMPGHGSFHFGADGVCHRSMWLIIAEVAPQRTTVQYHRKCQKKSRNMKQNRQIKIHLKLPVHGVHNSSCYYALHRLYCVLHLPYFVSYCTLLSHPKWNHHVHKWSWYCSTASFHPPKKENEQVIINKKSRCILKWKED